MFFGFILRFAYTLAAGIAFWFGEPSPSRRYVAEYNAEVLTLPESETAWRLVRKAAMLPAPLIEGAKYPDMGIEATVPEDPLWPAIVRANEANRERLDLALEVAKRRRMGMPLVVFDRSATPEAQWAMLDRVDLAENPSPLEVSLPYLGQIRQWSRELAADSRIAAESGDADRVVRNLTTMLKLAALLPEPPLLISQLVDCAVVSLVAREIGIVLASYPGLLDQNQLDIVAAEFRHTRTRLSSVDLEWEWAILFDWIGRVYSDDGHGNGVVTYAGLRSIANEKHPSTGLRAGGLVLGAMLGFDLSGAIGSKRELVERVEAARAAAGKDIETKPWLRGGWNLDTVVRDDGADMKQIGDFPLALLMPSLKKFIEVRNSALTQIDIAILITELEAYRLRTGDYPQSLSDLARVDPSTLPTDVFDGRLIRYLRREGDSPLLYSVGVDGVDDGGRVAKDNDAAGKFSGRNTFETGSDSEKERLQGDHVYWPPVQMNWIDEGEKPFTPRRALTKPK